MEAIGSEVGFKMRSAIKAKLNELGCYVDDELPDYVMVMVANKRSRSQMEDDLQLFLGSKTEMFVFWLHQVLQKLQEVKVPPLGSKESLTRQSSTDSSISIKKEKKDKKHKKSKKEEKPKKLLDKRPGLNLSLDQANSSLDITDVFANQLLETVKSKNNFSEDDIKTEAVQSNLEKTVQKNLFLEKDAHVVNQFDIPTISEIEKESSKLNVQLLEIKEIDKTIEKRRQEIQVMKSDSDEDVINLNNDEPIEAEELKSSTKVSDGGTKDTISMTPPRKQVMQRLGISKERTAKIDSAVQSRVKDIITSNMIDRSKRKSLNKQIPPVIQNKVERVSVHSRLGARPNNDSNNRISSKVVPVTSNIVEKEDIIPVTIPSIVKVKPRPQIPLGLQANKNLLLKAMADAQKSIAQVTKPQVSRRPLELYTKKFRINEKKQINYVSPRNKSDLRITVENVESKNTSFDKDNMEYTPEPILNDSIESNSSFQEYVPSQISKPEDETQDTEMEDEINLFPTAAEKKILNPQFVVTLDGLDTSNFPSRKRKMINTSTPIASKESKCDKTSLKKTEKRKHTPIVYDRHNSDEDKIVTVEKKIVSNEGNTIDITISNETSIQEVKSTEDTDKELMDRVNDTVKVIINEKVIDEQRHLNSGEAKVKLKEIQCKYDHIPDVLPEVSKKERCKYFPSCKMGDSCEYLHPLSVSSTLSVTCSVPCKAFPNCKYGSSCLYLHPRCKFGADCMKKRDCIYSHNSTSNDNRSSTENGSSLPPSLSSTVSVVPNNISHGNTYKSNGVLCRFYPMCSNLKCIFYHPKMCRFGKYCNNRAECNFYHQETVNKEKFVWKPAATTT